MKNSISLKEFLHISKLSANDALAMLDNAELPFTSGPLGEILIKIDEINVETIAFRARPKKEETFEQSTLLLEELIASEIVRGLDELFDDALSLAMRWNNKKENS